MRQRERMLIESFWLAHVPQINTEWCAFRQARKWLRWQIKNGELFSRVDLWCDSHETIIRWAENCPISATSAETRSHQRPIDNSQLFSCLALQNATEQRGRGGHRRDRWMSNRWAWMSTNLSSSRCYWPRLFYALAAHIPPNSIHLASSARD